MAEPIDELRAVVAAMPPAPADMAAYLEKVRDRAHTVVDARVDPREHCFPMIPAGAAALDLVEFEDDAEAIPA